MENSPELLTFFDHELFFDDNYLDENNINDECDALANINIKTIEEIEAKYGTFENEENFEDDISLIEGFSVEDFADLDIDEDDIDIPELNNLLEGEFEENEEENVVENVVVENLVDNIIETDVEKPNTEEIVDEEIVEKDFTVVEYFPDCLEEIFDGHTDENCRATPNIELKFEENFEEVETEIVDNFIQEQVIEVLQKVEPEKPAVLPPKKQERTPERDEAMDLERTIIIDDSFFKGTIDNLERYVWDSNDFLKNQSAAGKENYSPKTKSHNVEYKCFYCPEKFPKQKLLADHLTAEHSNKNLPQIFVVQKMKPKPRDMPMCYVCQKCYYTESALQRHVRNRHNIIPYSCEICKMGFAKESFLKIHKRHHFKTKRS